MSEKSEKKFRRLIKKEYRERLQKIADEQMARRPRFVPRVVWLLFIRWFIDVKRI